MKNFVVDASVAVKWLIPLRQEESDVGKALALFEEIARAQVRMIQPPHFIAEIMGVITRLEPDFADDIFEAVSNLDMSIQYQPEIYRTAIQLSIEFNHHLFDTLYHAVALNSSDTWLITADDAYYRKTKAVGCILSLREY